MEPSKIGTLRGRCRHMVYSQETLVFMLRDILCCFNFVLHASILHSHPVTNNIVYNAMNMLQNGPRPGCVVPAATMAEIATSSNRAPAACLFDAATLHFSTVILDIPSASSQRAHPK